MREHSNGQLTISLLASFVSRSSQFHPKKVKLRRTNIKEVTEHPRQTIGDFLIDKQFVVEILGNKSASILPEYKVMPSRRIKLARKLNFAHLIVKGGGISVSFDNVGPLDGRGSVKQVQITGKLTDYWGNELSEYLAKDLKTVFTKTTSDPQLLTYFRQRSLQSVKIEFSINNLKLTLNNGKPLIFDHYSQVEDPELLKLLDEKALVYKFDFVEDAAKHYAAGFGFQVLMDVLGFLDGHLAVTCRYLDSLDMLFLQKGAAADDVLFWESVGSCLARIERFEAMWADTFVGRKLTSELEQEFRFLGNQIFFNAKLRLQENLTNRTYVPLNNHDTPLEYKLMSFGTCWSQITDPLPFTETFLQKRTIITKPEFAKDFVFCFPGELMHQVLPNFLGFWSAAQPRISQKSFRQQDEKPVSWKIDEKDVLLGVEFYDFDRAVSTKRYALASGFNSETGTQEIVLFREEQVRQALKDQDLPNVNCTPASLHTRYSLQMSCRASSNFLTRGGVFTAAAHLYSPALILSFTPITKDCLFGVPSRLQITETKFQDVLSPRKEEFTSVYYSSRSKLVFVSVNYRDPKIDMPVDLRSDYAYLLCCRHNPLLEQPLSFVASGLSPCVRVGSKHTWIERKNRQFLLISTNYSVAAMCFFRKQFISVASTWNPKAKHLGEPVPREFFGSGGLHPLSSLLRHADCKPDAQGNICKRLFYVYPHF